MITQKPQCLSRLIDITNDLYGRLPYHYNVGEKGEIYFSRINVYGKYELNWVITEKELKMGNDKLEQWLIYNAEEVSK